MNDSENNAIAESFNKCMSKHSLAYSPIFDKHDFITTENVITNFMATSKLTDVVMMNYFPLLPISELHHFTDLHAFQSIISSNTLRLTSVAKRFSEDEFSPFYLAHGMDGYKIKFAKSGVQLERELVEDAFYISFTDGKLDTLTMKYMWRTFSKNTGVQLVFEFTRTSAEIRQVYYPNPKGPEYLPLLKDLVAEAQNFGKMLIPERLATMGFFYLPYHYKLEREYRLLVKRRSANYYGMRLGKKDGYEFVEMALGHSPLGQLSLKAVIAGPKTDKAQVRNILNSSTDHSHVAVV